MDNIDENDDGKYTPLTEKTVTPDDAAHLKEESESDSVEEKEENDLSPEAVQPPPTRSPSSTSSSVIIVEEDNEETPTPSEGEITKVEPIEEVKQESKDSDTDFTGPTDQEPLLSPVKEGA